MEVTKNDKNKYHSGKIYTIRSHRTDKYYIGSTCSPLHKRLYQHKLQYRMFQAGKFCLVTSFEIIKFDDCYIELYENYKCNSRNELTKREGEVIRLLKNEVVNIRVDGRTIKEYRADNKEKIIEINKEYRANNKAKIAEIHKEYRANNKDKIKKYYADNKANILEKQKEYYVDNKTKIAEKKKE